MFELQSFVCGTVKTKMPKIKKRFSVALRHTSGAKYNVFSSRRLVYNKFHLKKFLIWMTSEIESKFLCLICYVFCCYSTPVIRTVQFRNGYWNQFSLYKIQHNHIGPPLISTTFLNLPLTSTTSRPGVELHGYCQNIIQEYMFTLRLSINRQEHAFSFPAEHCISTGEVFMKSCFKTWSGCQLLPLRPWDCGSATSGCLSTAGVHRKLIGWYRRRQSQLLVMWTNTLQLEIEKRKVWKTRTHTHTLSNIHRNQAGCQHAVISWHFTKNCSDCFLSTS